MPMVVNTAMVEQPISIHSITSSTRLRARSSGVMRLRTTRMVPIAMHHDEHRERHAADAAQLYVFRGRRAHRFADIGGRHVAGHEVAHVVENQGKLVGRQVAHAGRQVVGDQPQDDGVLESHPQQDDRERRQRAPHRRHHSVMTGQRMQIAHTASAAHQGERTRFADPERADRNYCQGKK